MSEWRAGHPPISPMPEDSNNYDKLVYNLVPRIIKHLGVATPEGMFVMTDLIEVYDDILKNEPEMTQIIDHTWIGVAGHPDDVNCTYRSDGTDATYCGEPEYAHRWLNK